MKKGYALITGGSSGIGEAIAHELAKQSYSLILVSENESELHRVKQDILSRYTLDIEVIQKNLFDCNAAEKLYDEIQKKQIAIEILVNAAGVYTNAEDEREHVQKVHNLLSLHVLNFAKLCFLFGNHMIKNKHGYILTISSITSRFPEPASLTYGPSKSFVRSFSHSLFCDWRTLGVSVTCLVPGAIATPFFQHNQVFVPSWLKRFALPPQKCASIGVRALFKKKRIVNPGWFGKIQSMLFRLISLPIFFPMLKKTYYRMKAHEK